MVKILAIDTSSSNLSIAITENDKILIELNFNSKQDHCTNLMPHIDYILNYINLDISEIDYFALSAGPGSFTGLRIGLATVKAFSTVFNKKIIPISTLKNLAYNLFVNNKYIAPIIDAKSGRVFAGIYKWEQNKITTIYNDTNTTINEFLNYIKEQNLDVVFLGDGAKVYKNEIEKAIHNPDICPDYINYQKASNLAFIAFDMIKNNEYIDPNFDINYLRKSQAEIELLKKEKND